MPEAQKRLYRLQKNRVIAGICGGIGEYGKVDPVIIRLIWVIATLLTGVLLGVIAYLLAWMIIPPRR